MKRLIHLATLAALFSPCSLSAQNQLLFQQHKEIEYDYGVVQKNDYPLLSETEKIKYELRYLERTWSKTIRSDYHTTFEVKVDSNSYEQPWMTLPRKYVYGLTGVDLFTRSNEWLRYEPYSQEQMADRLTVRQDIMASGYHPGLVEFPEFTNEIINRLSEENIRVEVIRNGVVKVSSDERNFFTYDKENLAITRSWQDENGNLNVETNGYEPYAGNEGYLLRITKSERFVQSPNGPCVTEVKLTYYSDYVIRDYARLIDKAVGNIISLALYPNPNDGIFTVSVNMAAQDRITLIKAVNLLDHTETQIDNAGQSTFPVDVSLLNPGHYVLQVFTGRSASAIHFFKN